MSQGSLEVPGAVLHYEVRGSGTVLLMMPGGPATASVFERVAVELAADFTVVTYDPRGLSRSRLTGAVDDERLVETLADDVHRLLAAVTDALAFVFANSGGAVIALELAARHPAQLRALVAHEPPRFGAQPPEGQPHGDDEVHDAYLREGVEAALLKFMRGAGLGEPPAAMLAGMSPWLRSDLEFFFGHYWRGLGMYEPDLEEIRRGGCLVIPAAGEDSAGEPAHAGGLGLAKLLGVEAAILPGGHGGFESHPAEFAARLRQLLASL